MTNASSASPSYRERKRDHGLGWVPWAAFLGLLLLALLAFLIVRNVADDGDRAGVDATNDNTAVAVGDAANAGPASGAAGVMTENGIDVLALAAGNRLGEVDGNQVTATNVAVASVVTDEGFWVGSGQGQLFVYLTEGARAGAGESPYQVRAGQRVDVTGQIASVSGGNEFDLSQGQGAQRLETQGSYLRADSIRIR